MGQKESKFMWKELVLKDVNVVKREGKSDLVFVDVVDPNTYESSGQYMYMPVDRAEVLPPVGTIVDVYTKPGNYAGRPSINFGSVQASKPNAVQKTA